MAEALAVWIPGGSESSGRPSIGLKIENFTDDYQALQSLNAIQGVAAVVESCDDAIITKDLNGIITSWNSGAQRIFGYSAEEAIGKPVTILIPPDLQNEEPRILERIRRGERIAHYETIRTRKDDRSIDISLTISPLRKSRVTLRTRSDPLLN
jgi:PAS domain S-box-containing protein